jgi:hypothetical protein
MNRRIYMVKKAKRKLDEKQWHVQLECEVTLVKAGHFPDTVYVKLPDGHETEVDLAYLAKRK